VQVFDQEMPVSQNLKGTPSTKKCIKIAITITQLSAIIAKVQYCKAPGCLLITDEDPTAGGATEGDAAGRDATAGDTTERDVEESKDASVVGALGSERDS